MPTDRQLAANRANAQKSTGPRTPEGKSASSRNALKSGIYSKALLIPGEDPAEFEALKQEHYDYFQPANIDERDLLDLLIRHKWMLRRLQDCYDQTWIRALESDLNSQYHKPTSPLVYAYNRNEDRLDKLARMVHASDRAFHRARAALIKAQDKRRRNPPTPPPPPELALIPPKRADPAPVREIGFVSRDLTPGAPSRLASDNCLSTSTRCHSDSASPGSRSSR
jgi:hypothetical protein